MMHGLANVRLVLFYKQQVLSACEKWILLKTRGVSVILL
jgi:hypothetical protein